MSTPNTPSTPSAAPSPVPVYSPAQNFSINVADIPLVLLIAAAFGLWPYLLPMVVRNYPAAEILHVGIGAVVGAIAAFFWKRAQEHEPPVAFAALTVVAVIASLVVGSLCASVAAADAYATIAAAAVLAAVAWITSKF